ncbi:MAG: iron-containing redox enzyme family protein [Bdellovibrionota bacterium]|nr:MAG: iron-containing redox enzyme family protein [Bdellovibrionota bacterium]
MNSSTKEAGCSSVRCELEAVIHPYLLLNHPFYRAWSEGSLPRQSLELYAREYGAFVREIGAGWETLGDEETAHEEEEHAELWEQFAKALGTSVGPVVTKEVEQLLKTASELFSSKEGALGALYAFELQQPETATSKLEGLRAFYQVPKEAERYFEEHAKNHHEARKLEHAIAQLTESQQQLVKAACARMAKALWDGLSGIHGEKCSLAQCAQH